MSVIEKAAHIATIAHKDQVRKTDDSPYIIHPFMVAFKLARHNFPDHVIAAALLHDVLEDTSITEEKLRSEFDDEVVGIVRALSEDKSLPWEERKQNYIEVVRKGSPEVKAVSISDKIHNAESLLIAHAEQGPSIWEKFSRGKEKQLWFAQKLLEMFKETWQHPLVKEYERLVERMKELVPL